MIVFMGRWSRAAGAEFLDWVAPPTEARWLDIGCGTGVFTELVFDKCLPSELFAIDPTPAQVEYARRQPVAKRAEFQVADAQKLPFPDRAFDVVAAALVISFIADRVLALAEMRRVGRRDGIVTGYVWDFEAERTPGTPLRLGLRQIGIESPVVPGTAASTLDALRALFEKTGFENIATRTIDITLRFENFDALWHALTPVFNPVTRMVASLSGVDRVRMIDGMRAALPVNPDGSVGYTARANAIRLV